METEELIKLHQMNFGPDYLPDPNRHLSIPRDLKHYQYTISTLRGKRYKTILDIGCFDGWLDFLLTRMKYWVTGIELIEELANAANRYADRNFIPYKAHHCRFMETEIKSIFDVVLCYETLEHVSFEDVPGFIDKMESLCNEMILISLPDQKHEDNIQHQWTPTEEVIKELFGHKKNFDLQYFSYGPGPVPPNWFISYEV